MIFMSDSQNSRISHLLSPDSLEGKTLMIVGLGSLGFPAMQHLAMSGVHRWVLVDFDTYEEEFEGISARIIQHEYDHIEGVLFVDYLSSLKKRMLNRKLNDISKGNVKVDYRMKFPQKKGR